MRSKRKDKKSYMQILIKSPSMRMFGTFKKPQAGVQAAGLAAMGDGAVSEAQFIKDL